MAEKNGQVSTKFLLAQKILLAKNLLLAQKFLLAQNLLQAKFAANFTDLNRPLDLTNII